MTGFSGGARRNNDGNLARLGALDLLVDLRRAAPTSFYSANASTVQTVLLPAANVAGVVVVLADLIGNTAPAAIFADTAAPSAWDDVTRWAFLMAPTNGKAQLELPLLIPAGRGLYHHGNALVRLGYRVL